MKKLIIVLISVTGLGLIFAFIAPFVVDLNKFKPVIRKVVEQHVNGSFDVEDIKLSLFSGFGAEIRGVTLKNSDKFDNATIIKSDFIKLRTSILSIFRGVSYVDLKIKSPEINLLKNETGDLNLTDLVNDLIYDDSSETNHEKKENSEKIDNGKDLKSENKKDLNDSSQVNQKEDAKSTLEQKVVSLIRKIVINVRLTDASIRYEDLSTKSLKLIKNIDLSLLKIQLGKEFDFNLKSLLAVSDFGINGPVNASGTVNIDFIKGMPDIEMKGLVDLNDLEIDFKDYARKTKRNKSSMEFYFSFKEFKVKFTKTFKMSIENLFGRKFDEVITVDSRINSNLSRDYLPEYSDVRVSFSSKGSDASVRFRVSQLNNVNFEVKSDYFNLDDFLEPPPVLLNALFTKKEEGKPDEKINNDEKEENDSDDLASKEDSSDTDSDADIDTEKALSENFSDPFAEIKNDPFFLDLIVSGDINFNRIIASRVEIKNLLATLTLNKLKIFSSCTLNVFRGNINTGQFIFNMRTRRPLFNIDTILIGIDMNEAVSKLTGLEDVMSGRINGNFEFTGAGIDPETIKQTLKGDAKFNGKNIKIKAFNLLEAVKKEIKGLTFLNSLKLANHSFNEGIDKFLLELNTGNGKINIDKIEFFRSKQYLLSMAGEFDYEPSCNLTGSLYIIPPLSGKIAGGSVVKKVFFNSRGDIVLPFYMKGKFSDLSYGIDNDKTEELYSKKTKNAVVGEVKKIIKDTKISEKVLDKVPKKQKKNAEKLLKKFGF